MKSAISYDWERFAALKDGRLDVPAFVRSREFEIKQLENSMASNSSSKQRAFQLVPRSFDEELLAIMSSSSKKVTRCST